jgi:hypothetical protein
MKSASKIELPVLNDIVIPGKNVPPTDELPPVLDEIQVQALQQQIDKIVESRLKKATEQAVKDIQDHLDKVIPKFIEMAKKTK